MHKAAFVILILSLISVSCAVKSYDNLNNERRDLLKRVKAYVLAEHLDDFATIWEMSTPWLKEEVTKNEFVNHAQSFPVRSKFIGKEKITIVVQKEKYAIVDVQDTLILFEDEKNPYSFCVRKVWLKFPDNWYWWHKTFNLCDSMPNEDEIESLTQKIP